ncbi:Uu.00g015590.m01.CDS01 [Anthostomella pinea]|uniref:Uu.00g015590.m01.CDS01 n=1 Tax=Anthostomella pinea TaxID=933095 RepID=A0AAI8VZG3_9PEZI|nr:Uu.00g015590.m01.CDS01 [Anthostomella pinea]
MDPASLPFPSPHPRLHGQPTPHHFRIPTLPSQSNLDLGPLDATEATLEHHLQRLQAIPNMPIGPSDFGQHHQHHPLQHQPLPPLPQSTSDLQGVPHHRALPPPPPLPPPAHSAPPTHSQFAILTPNLSSSQPAAIPQILADEDVFAPPPHVPSSALESSEHKAHGQLVNRIVTNPPDLKAWRERLFNVDDTITLTNDQFETYFPHIDNVYSHRSTQKYKRKPFISHYWDCRMKGRPPGTPKSEDPSKKKRKRFARERDLCDVKIKITEHFPGSAFSPDGESIPGGPQSSPYQPPPQAFSDGLSRPPNGYVQGEKYWTIQRVNGNGGNGKADGVAGPHKHTLEKSDEIKKSSVQRFVATQGKESKKIQKPTPKRPSGDALATARKHLRDHELKLYAASFCPFSQRVWIALEAKGMQYQYCEIDPFTRPTQLLEANPRGLVPAIRQGDWASGESTIILEYVSYQSSARMAFPGGDSRVIA